MASLNDIETKVRHIIDLLEDRTIKTITGVLPLTFTTTEDKLRDWEIRGNDDAGENLFDISKVSDRTISGHTFLQVVNGEIHVDLTASTSTPDGNNHTLRDLVGNLELNQAYSLSATSTGSAKYFFLNGTGANFAWDFNESKTFTTQESLDAALDARILWFASGTNTTATISNIMFTAGSTAPDHFIPYQQGVGEQRVDGYYIPLTISQQGQPDKTVDIYIGDSPLTEGETVSKTSTGVDIELFEGENTINTTLYNKPEMIIKYK